MLFKLRYLIEDSQPKYTPFVTKNYPGKWHAPEGLFKNSDAQKISDTLSQNGEASYKQAIGRITFYVNRAGKNLSEERLKTMQTVKDLIRKRYNREQNTK